MVLAGIGGKTIREAKANLTSDEASDWALYIQKHGPVSPQQRMIHGFATAAWATWSGLGVKLVGGRKPTIQDFIPRKEAPQDASIEDVFILVQSLSKESKS